MPTSMGIDRARLRIAELFGVEAESIETTRGSHATSYLIAFGRVRLAIDLRRDATTASVLEGAARARATARPSGRATIPIVVVPFAGDAARNAARRESVGLLDLAGNAVIHGGSVHIHVEGRPDPSPRRGRPRDAFAPRARRVVATLLDDPSRRFTQRELAAEAGLDEGRTSRVVRALVDDGLLERDAVRRVHLSRIELCVDAYRDARRFETTDARSFAVTTRSHEATVRIARELLASEGIAYAATGQLAAHALTSRATARHAVFYVDAFPSQGALALAGFRADDSRGNVSFVLPRDTRPIERARYADGLPCAPSIEVYADLCADRDASPELVDAIRSLVLRRDSDDDGRGAAPRARSR